MVSNNGKYRESKSNRLKGGLVLIFGDSRKQEEMAREEKTFML